MKAINLEVPACPLCGSSDSTVVYGGKHFAPYGVVSCQMCGMQFLSPRPTEEQMLTIYGQNEYFSGNENGYRNYVLQERALRVTFRRLLENLASRGVTGGDLLEIGCGYGYLLDEARPFFSRRVGTDFSIGAAERARSVADQVIVGGVNSVIGDEMFDCAIATHVIEHVYEPHKFVQDITERLRNGGRLVVAAPDMGSWWRKILGRRWPSFKLPEHVLYFDRATLSRLLTECGLSNVVEVPYPHAFPIATIAEKLGCRTPSILEKYHLWIPQTTVAYMGTKNA